MLGISTANYQIWRPGKNGGYPNFASDVSCVPGCRGDSVARHSSFKTWSRLGVGDRLRGSHLDQDQVSLSSQPPVFPGLDPNVQEHEFWAVYDAERMRASGSLRTAIANHFVPNQDRERLTTLARGYWEYPASALYPDVKPVLKALATQFKLGLVANSGEAALKALRRDGLRDLFTVIALADFVGVEKHDERIFLYALKTAGVSPSRAVHVGNRLESDVRPAQKLGMRTVWLLRGDAPPAPTLDQLAEPDAVIISLVGLPTALSRLTGSIALTHSSGSIASLES